MSDDFLQPIGEQLLPSGAPGVPEEAVLTALDGELSKRFHAAREARREIERRLFEDLWRRNGEYPPELFKELKDAGSSTAFDNITEQKCAAAQAMLVNMLLLSDGPFWGLEPTPMPELSAMAKEEASRRVAMEAPADITAETEGMVEKLAAEIEKVQREEAAARCGRMEKLIADALAETDFPGVLKDVLHDFTTYGTAAFMGPMPRIEMRATVQGNALVHEERMVLATERVSPFELFPAALSSKARDGDFFVRRLISDDDAAAIASLPRLIPGRYEAAILRRGSSAAIEDDTLDRARATEEKRVPSAVQDAWVPDGMHELVYWWHRMTDREIAEGRREDPTGRDDMRRTPMMGLLLNGIVITMEPNWDATGRPQVHIANYRANPDSCFGIGVSALCRDKQNFVNVMTRACLKNAVMSSHPSFIAQADRFDDFSDLFKQFPGKVYAVKPPAGATDTGKPLEMLVTPNNTSQFLSDRERMDAACEDAAGIYRQSYGSPRQVGPAQTASGYNMLREDQTVMTKMAVANLSIAIKSLVRAHFIWFMLTGPDDAKGDMEVVTRGAVQLYLSSDTADRIQGAIKFLQSGDAIAAGAKPEAIQKLAREYLRTLKFDPDDYLFTPDELQRQREAAEAAPPPEEPDAGEGPVPEAEPVPPAPKPETESDRMRAEADMIRARAAETKAQTDRERLDVLRAKTLADIRMARRRDAAAAAAARPANGGGLVPLVSPAEATA